MILFGGNLKKYLVFLFTSCVLVTMGKDEFIKKVGNLDVLLLDVKTVLEKKSIFNWLECDPTYVIYQVHNSFVIKKNIIIFSDV